MCIVALTSFIDRLYPYTARCAYWQQHKLTPSHEKDGDETGQTHILNMSIYGTEPRYTWVPQPSGRCDQKNGIGKAIPAQAWTGLVGSRKVRLPEFLDNRHMEVLRCQH